MNCYVRPNQALKLTVASWVRYAWLARLRRASIGFSLNNFFFSVNSLRWVHVENYQRRNPFRLKGGTRSRPDIVISGRT